MAAPVSPTAELGHTQGRERSFGPAGRRSPGTQLSRHGGAPGSGGGAAAARRERLCGPWLLDPMAEGSSVPTRRVETDPQQHQASLGKGRGGGPAAAPDSDPCASKARHPVLSALRGSFSGGPPPPVRNRESGSGRREGQGRPLAPPGTARAGRRPGRGPGRQRR